MDASAHLAVLKFRDREQLDHAAQPRRVGDVLGLHPRDPFAEDVAGHHPRVERDRCEDRALGRGVEPLDVGGGIGLRVAEGLGLGQRVVEARRTLGHLREDEVRRAVHDAEDASDALPGQRLLHRTDQRDPPGHRRLEVEIRARRSGGVEELLAVVGQELLVRGHDRLPVAEGAKDQRPGRLPLPEELADDVDVGIVDDGAGVGREDRGVDRNVSGSPWVPHRDARDPQPAVRAQRDVVGAVVQQTDHRCSHVPAPQQPDPEHPFAHVTRSSPIRAAMRISSSYP